MLMNDPTREYNKLYEIKNDRNLYEGGNWKYINLPVEKVKEFAKSSVLGDDPMYFSCDVGKQLDKDNGYLDVDNYEYGKLFGVDFGMNKEQRIRSFESGSTHGMALIGVDLDENENPRQWLLENSWGTDTGNKGMLMMTDEWFSEYMFRLVIHRKYIDDDVLKILDTEPIMLPQWDPMFSGDK